MGGSLTIDILRKSIIDLILNEINNDESNISKMIIDYAKNNINTIINNDNIENDINWDELDQLFGSFSDNGVISISENNEYILSIDETNLPTYVTYKIERYKARLVAKGYTQTYGVDF